MLVKLCGFTEENSVKVAIAQKCDFLGFIFYEKSPRYITPQNAAKISRQVPSNIAKVAVVVDCDFDFLEKIVQEFTPDFFQFHGNESVDFLAAARRKFPQIKIIKAFKIFDVQDLESVKDFENYTDYFLFDSKVVGEAGGSGKKFDWKILENFSSRKDWFLSGGLNIENIEEALKLTGAKMIDISSGIEKIRGQKSSELIEELMKKMNSIK